MNVQKSIITAMLTLLGVFSAQAYDFLSGELAYNFYDDTSVYVTYRGSTDQAYGYPYPNNVSDDLIIPASVTYNGKTYAVTGIGPNAFYKCQFDNVTIPNSVTTIGGYAFYECI